MEYIRLGSTGLKVSRICRGCAMQNHYEELTPLAQPYEPHPVLGHS